MNDMLTKEQKDLILSNIEDHKQNIISRDYFLLVLISCTEDNRLFSSTSAEMIPPMMATKTLVRFMIRMWKHELTKLFKY